jgi:large subunit ribosomal protein L29
MKGREKEAIRNMSVPELEAKLREAQEAHFRMQFRHASNPLRNPLLIRQQRRQVARLKTWLHAKRKEVA